MRAPGIEIGRPNDSYRRIRIESVFGKITVFVTEGHLPYPYGRELTGYEVANLDETLAKAKSRRCRPCSSSPTAAGIVDRRWSNFPGGYIAEIHSLTSK